MSAYSFSFFLFCFLGVLGFGDVLPRFRMQEGFQWSTYSGVIPARAFGGTVVDVRPASVGGVLLLQLKAVQVYK